LSLIGGSGIVGILFYFLRRYIEGRLKRSEECDEHHKDQRLRRLRLEDEKDHAEGRLLFWLYKAIVTGHHNGDLDKAMDTFLDAESRKKELDREILAEVEIE
jgi:hypothetical protein